MLSHHIKWVTAIIAILATPLTVLSQVNMIGLQSQNEGLTVLPADKPLTIDGDLSDWDTSGRILCFANQKLSDRYSAQVTTMWDQQYLYCAIKWNDPSPMGNHIDPRFNADVGWKSDCLQLRFRTADEISWIDGWYYKPTGSSMMRVVVWDDTNWQQNKSRSLYSTHDNWDIGEGAQQAFAKTDTGYIQEMRIPWTFLFRKAPDLKSGLTFQMGFEFLWGDPAGSDKLTHRYADNIQAGITSREFYWNNYRVWGNATLTDKHNIAMRQYIAQSDRLTGPLPIKFTVPEDAKVISLAIDDAQGNRVRNIGGLSVANYTVAKHGKQVDVSIPWDTMADPTWRGDPRKGFDPVYTPVSAGQYTVKALYHKGIDATYEMSYYNPGTPVWDVADTSGAWGADHTSPHLVARSGDRMVIGWLIAEGGWGIIAIGPNGRKIWSEKRGAQQLAADDRYVYVVPRAFGNISLEPALIRMDSATGDYKPFIKDGKPLPFERHLADIFDVNAMGDLHDMAVSDKLIALAYANDTIILLDKSDTSRVAKLTVKSPAAIAFDAKNQLFSISDGKLCKVDTKTGKTQAIATPGLAQPVGLTCDSQDNLLINDLGPDCQVKAYSQQGKLAYTCGRQGGRPLRGLYDPQGMSHMHDVAVDHNGHVWVTEDWDYPRRVSVWGRDGKLVRDYIGNTSYAANSNCLHDTDPTLAYIGPLEFKIDHAKRTWKLQRIIWYPDYSKGECFEISTHRFAKPQVFSSNASGQTRQYFFSIPYYTQHSYVLFMQEDSGDWKPVSAITTVSQISGKMSRRREVLEKPSGEWADCDLLDNVFWNDRNADGIVQRSECQIVKTEYPAAGKQRGKKPALNFTSGWGGRMDNKLRFYASGMVRIEPVGFDDRGAPIYTPDSVHTLPVKEAGTMVPDRTDKQVLVLSKYRYPRPSRVAGIDGQTGKVNWSYPNPYPGVHGSHRATMPKPGLIIGPLLITGSAHVSDAVGDVFHMRGNLGQDYFMTTDGLFVGTLFQDGRLPSPPLPPTEAQLVGKSVNAYTQSGEPFNGFFGKQADGQYRLTTALARQAAMILDVHGLKTITRLPQQTVTVTDTLIAKALQDKAQNAGDAHGVKIYSLTHANGKITIDGQAGDWKNVPSLSMDRAGGVQSGTAKLAYDKHNLYLFYDIKDPSPWLNSGKVYHRLFKTGDAIDVQLSPTANDKRDPVAGDLRVVIGLHNGKPSAVLMMPVKKSASQDLHHVYASPIMTHPMDEVMLLDQAQIAVNKKSDSYQIEAAIPLKAMGLKLKSGMKLRGDFGFISSDASGTIDTARTYWSNKQTNLVSDLPSEAWLYPEQWGSIEVK